MKIKTLTLAALAAAVTLLASPPVSASTSWARGGNWADTDANVTGIHLWAGLAYTTTPAEATNVADQVVADYTSAGINFVRVAVNPATVSSTNWPILKDCINVLVAKGMTVDIGCWYCDVGHSDTITNMTLWQDMWQTIDGIYKNNNSVYYEPINEPNGYSLSSLEGVYTTFLGFIQKSQSHILLDGFGYAADVTGIGADPSLSSCLLSLHIYPGWGSCVSESQYESYLSTHVGSYSGRTIITEVGAPTGTGKNYLISNNSDDEISCIRGVCIQAHAWGMGVTYWPATIPRAGNGSIDGDLLYSAVGGTITNASMIAELNYGWNNQNPLTRSDFMGDGMDDYVYFHPSDATWHVTFATGLDTNIFQWGNTGDVPLVDGAWDGSAVADAVVWRPSNGTWYIRSSIERNEMETIQWGQSGDIPLLGGDFDGDGVPDPVIWRPSTATWYIWSTKNERELTSFQWGATGDIPLLNGDFDGDGVPDAVIFSPPNNTWYVWSSKNARELYSFQFGTNGCVPILRGDFDGDGIPDAQYWSPTMGTWSVRYSSDGSIHTFTWGVAGNIPFTAYITPDHVVDENVYSPPNGRFYVRNSSSGDWFDITTAGSTNDIPVY